MTQGSFDAALAKEEAIQRVEEHASPDWMAWAWVAAVEAAQFHTTFTADDVWAHLEEGIDQHEPRALGPVMRRLQAEGLAEPTDSFQLSARVSRHRAPIRIWRSLIVQSDTQVESVRLE